MLKLSVFAGQWIGGALYSQSAVFCLFLLKFVGRQAGSRLRMRQGAR